MNTNFTHTEASLIAGCIKGDRKCQKALYELYSPKLLSICMRYTKNQMDAEDVLQDGFIKTFNNLHKFNADGSFEGWLRRIFVNTAIEYLRKKKMETLSCECYENTIFDKAPSPLENLYKKDVIKETQKLSTGYQTVFNLYAVEGYSHQQIAQSLGITESTSKSQFSRAKAILRTIVQGRTTMTNLQQAV